MSDPNELMVWREVLRLIEREDGTFYTEFVEYRWVPMWDRQAEPIDLIYAVPTDPAEYREPTRRCDLGL